MKTSIVRSLALLSLAWCATLPLAHAHSVWVEDTADKKLVVRFGELGGEIESSPGHLDSLSLPVAWAFGAEGKAVPFTVEKKSDHFLFVGAAPASAAFGETRFPVMKRGERPASWPQFYVRWHPTGTPAPSKPALTLDILPTATTGEFRVYLRGKPLPAAKVIAHLAKGEMEIDADTEGRVRFQATEPGIVLLTCNHKENTPGFSGGAAYDVTSHNTALTWRQP